MANIFLFTTIAIVVSTSVNCERRAFLRNANNLPKVLHNLKHDKEELNENLVKNEGQPREEMRMGPRPPPLYPNYPAQWLFGAHQNHLSDKEHTQQRIQQLQNKLNNQPPNRIPKQTLNQPHPKPEIEVKLYENHRHKREATQLENDFRQKRDVVINPHMQPEVVMQPHIQPALLQEIEAKNVRPSLNLHIYNPSIYYPDIVESIVNKSGHHEEKDAEKRDKRQILLLIKQQPLKLGKKPRTTPNPFIRETNIADYDIGKTNVDKPEIDTIDTVDTDSYELSPIQKILSEFTKMLLNLKNWLDHPKENPLLQLRNSSRIKRSPKMSKLYKKQKLAKKKRKKKKQQKLTPRQIKHYRRIREHKEKRRRILHKKLKEKRRLRHKKMGTGPYNKSIIDYYGVYFDPPSTQLNDSLYDSIYDTNAIDSEQLYQEHLKNYPDYSGEKEDNGDDSEDSEDEDYTLEDSSDQKDDNSTVICEDPPSIPLNESLYDSIYDTEAVDSDKMYEEQMKNYPESDEEEESEEESNDGIEGSNDKSKGDDDKEKKKDQKDSTEIKNKDNKNNKLKNTKDMRKRQKMKNSNIKQKFKKSNTDGKSFLKSNNRMQKSNFEKHITLVNKQKSVSKLSRVKLTGNNNIPKTKLTREHLQSKNNVPKIHNRDEQIETKYNQKSHLVDIIYDNKLMHDKSNLRLNYKDNMNYLFGKQDGHLPSSHYEHIVPIIMREYTSVHRRMPI